MMTHLPQCAELVRLVKTTVRKLFVLPSVYQLRYGTWALQKRDARWTASVTFKSTWWGRNVHVNGVGRSSRSIIYIYQPWKFSLQEPNISKNMFFKYEFLCFVLSISTFLGFHRRHGCLPSHCGCHQRQNIRRRQSRSTEHGRNEGTWHCGYSWWSTYTRRQEFWNYQKRVVLC